MQEYLGEHVCWFVWLFVYTHMLGTICPNFTKFSVHVADGRGLILFWQCYNTLCTSSFVDGHVLLYYNGPCGDVMLPQQPHYSLFMS